MFKQHRISIMTAILTVTMGLPLQSSAASPEQRCTELGTNCICSEPLQMTGFTTGGNPVWAHDPNDSTTKQCAGENGVGFFIQKPNLPGPQIGSDGSVLNTLPVGHSVQRYMRGNEGHTGQFEMTHVPDGSTPRQRIAVRWYVWFSPNYEWKDPSTPLCTNSGKWFIPYPGGGQWANVDVAPGGGPWLIYGIEATVGGVTNPDCCSVGPGWDGAAGNNLTLGHWYRVEAIVRGWTGAGGAVRFEAYRKNVTTNGPEYKVIDTFIPCPGCGTGGTSWPGGTMSMNGGPVNRLEINIFRFGTCAGYRAYSHAMVAAWDTDAGQRIGAASEVEGGAGSSPPAAPATLRITELLQRLWGALWSPPPAFAR